MPVPVDVSRGGLQPRSRLRSRRRSRPRTRFLLPVHLYGQLADMRALRELGERHGLVVLEDACQAHGATRDGIRAGAAGHAGGVQLLPGQEPRRLRRRGRARHRRRVARGERARAARARPAARSTVTTSRATRRGSTRSRRSCSRASCRSSTAGTRSAGRRLAIYIGGARRRRRSACCRRSRATASRSGTSTSSGPRSRAARGGPTRARHRTGRHYPEPPHLSPAYAHLGHRAGDFPVAEAIGRECLSLPIFPGHDARSSSRRSSAGVEEFFRDGG